MYVDNVIDITDRLPNREKRGLGRRYLIRLLESLIVRYSSNWPAG
jgi:hypothetical protein